MNPHFDCATKFFHACESLKGSTGCKQYLQNGARFYCQAEPVSELTTIEQYTDWLQGLGTTALKGLSYTLNASTFDPESNKSMFFGTVSATHCGDGGPIAPTYKSTSSDYVYVITTDQSTKIIELVKIWNSNWALRELGWQV